jgi:Uma2 family endonuclease
MLALVLIGEIVSPGAVNYGRDYKDKREQYEAPGILECWLLDPQRPTVMVLMRVNGDYQEALFQGGERIISRLFPALTLMAEQVLPPVE